MMYGLVVEVDSNSQRGGFSIKKTYIYIKENILTGCKAAHTGCSSSRGHF